MNRMDSLNETPSRRRYDSRKRPLAVAVLDFSIHNALGNSKMHGVCYMGLGRCVAYSFKKGPEGWPEGMPNRPHTRAPSRVWLFPAAPGVNRKYILHGDGRVGVELKELMIPGGLVSGQPKDPRRPEIHKTRLCCTRRPPSPQDQHPNRIM